jgi:hypothetical protein
MVTPQFSVMIGRWDHFIKVLHTFGSFRRDPIGTSVKVGSALVEDPFQAEDNMDRSNPISPYYYTLINYSTCVCDWKA